jgi:hypothetical protein
LILIWLKPLKTYDINLHGVFLLILLSLLSKCSGAQLTLVSVDTLYIDCDLIHAESNGTLLFTKGDRIYRINDAGDTLQTQSVKNKGEITEIKSMNFLRTSLFYRDQLEIIVLDNSLSIQGEPVSLASLGFHQVTEIAPSQDNGYWVFDAVNQEFVKLNESFETTFTSQNMITLTGKALEINSMAELNGELIFADSLRGVGWLDRFGTLKWFTELTGISNIHVFTIAAWLQVDEGFITVNSDSQPDFKNVNVFNTCGKESVSVIAKMFQSCGKHLIRYEITRNP